MRELADSVAAGGKRVSIFGVVAMVLGVLAMLAPALTGISIILLLGGLVAISGALRMAWAFRSHSLGRGLWLFAIGSLTLLCGVAMLANPLFGSAVMTIILAIYFLLDGIAEIALGVGRLGEGGGWLLFGGVVSLLLGVLIWMQYPLSGAWAMGILLGIKLFFVGLTMIVGGSALSRLASAGGGRA
jgi:uncharacterized membrane protein HdeD (DUF308 family)